MDGAMDQIRVGGFVRESCNIMQFTIKLYVLVHVLVGRSMMLKSHNFFNSIDCPTGMCMMVHISFVGFLFIAALMYYRSVKNLHVRCGISFSLK